jgi:osmotically-inducible protein OsmY
MTRLATAEAAVSADEFADSLESQIQRRLGGRVRDLRVLLREDGVILQGRSATYHAKQLAQHAAMELAGVRVLANDIEVC